MYYNFTHISEDGTPIHLVRFPYKDIYDCRKKLNYAEYPEIEEYVKDLHDGCSRYGWELCEWDDDELAKDQIWQHCIYCHKFEDNTYSQREEFLKYHPDVIEEDLYEFNWYEMECLLKKKNVIAPTATKSVLVGYSLVKERLVAIINERLRNSGRQIASYSEYIEEPEEVIKETARREQKKTEMEDLLERAKMGKLSIVEQRIYERYINSQKQE